MFSLVGFPSVRDSERFYVLALFIHMSYFFSFFKYYDVCTFFHSVKQHMA